MRTARADFFSFLYLGVALIATGPVAASAQRPPENDRIVLSGNVPALARPELEIGRVRPSLALERMILTLARPVGAEEKLERRLRELQDPTSPRFHQWLTPEQFGSEFGLSDAQIGRVSHWLERHGFTIESVGKGRGWINFSGTAAQVEETFATELHDYNVDGVVRHANATEPSIPRELGGLVAGIVSLNNFPHHPQHTAPRPLGTLRPAFTVGVGHSMGPTDFATIYNLEPIYAAGLQGSGQGIAITARADIDLPDIRIFRNYFGLPPGDPVVIHNGAPPAEAFFDDFVEVMLDTQWSGAVAPKATVSVIVSASTQVTDGIDLSAQFAVDQNVAGVVSTSFGQCEAVVGIGVARFYDQLWAQAAAEGITALVSSGDSGAAGCNASDDARGKGKGVNGLCSSPNDVCVGGTQFNDTANPGSFWAAINNFDNESSARHYIPEIGWNESGLMRDGEGLFSSGGGVSLFFPKPSWQVSLGVPADGKRDVPDVSLTAALHDGYVVSLDGILNAVGGTSAASPSFAGIVALINEKTGTRQGNINPSLYALGAAQYSHTGPAVFHDILRGSNSVPRQVGFSCGVGYDLVTGLGSVNGASLINNWP